MKKLLLMFIAVSTLTLTSCNNDDDEKGVEKTIINVKVTKNGKNVSGETVSMFDSKKGPNSKFFTLFFADKKVITESNGIASFDLLETFDLDVIDSQTTFYFGVFNDKTLLGRAATTIKKGETKTIEIKL